MSEEVSKIEFKAEQDINGNGLIDDDELKFLFVQPLPVDAFYTGTNVLLYLIDRYDNA